jgi:epoxyqueuosine reductase
MLPSVRPLLDDPSPLVRAMAVWALKRLASPEEQSGESTMRMPSESDAAVRAEWETSD